MILLLSGEGPTDLGTEEPTDQGWRFAPGPMSIIVDKLLSEENRLNYSLLDLHTSHGEYIYFLSEQKLSKLRHPRPRFFPRNSTLNSGFHRAEAYQLGKEALKIALERNDSIIAIFFRDSDGTNTSPKNTWDSKFQSIKCGFELAEFSSGVPMIPRPKSEAWMLCGLRKKVDPNCECSHLEEAPGNDNSPNSLKRYLEQYLQKTFPNEDTTGRGFQAALVRDGKVAVDSIDLPSFLAFVKELNKAFQNANSPLN